MHRENQNFCAQMMRFNSTANLQPIHDGHRVIDDRYVRLHLQDRCNGGPAVNRFAADDPVGTSFDDRAKSGPHDFMVVRNQDSLHSSGPVDWNHRSHADHR